MLVRKLKGCGKGMVSKDKALLLMGTYITNKSHPNGRSAILVGYSPIKALQEDLVTGLFRESNRFDLRRMSNLDELVTKKMVLDVLLKLIFVQADERAGSLDSEKIYEYLLTSSFPFCLRWIKASTPNLKDWSYAVPDSRVVSGHIEVEIPFVIMRSEEGVKEGNNKISQ